MSKVNFIEETNYTQEKFNTFFESKNRDIVLYGGAGSGKSYSVADKMALEVLRQDVQGGGKLKFVVIRRSLPSLKRTCIPIIKQEFERFGVHYHLHKQDMIAEVGERSEIYFISVNNKQDYEKVKSITDLDFIWIEEANEIPLDVYQGIIKLRLRGGKGLYAQRIFTFNPISRFIWLYDYHFVNDYDKALKIQVTIDDNKFGDTLFKEELEKLKDQNYNLYKVYRLGEFGTLEGIIYPNCKSVNIIRESADRFYGLDFGFNNPCALIEENYIDGEYDERQLLYERGLTNGQLIGKLKKIIPIELRSKPLYCDSAEPDRIQEICNAGFNAKPAKKNVAMGIDFCQRATINMHEDSTELIKENDTYCWATNKDGEKIDEPVKFNDHLMDARRYAIFTHSKNTLEGIDKSFTSKEFSSNYQF
jgi:phage terminase large subunit